MLLSITRRYSFAPLDRWSADFCHTYQRAWEPMKSRSCAQARTVFNGRQPPPPCSPSSILFAAPLFPPGPRGSCPSLLDYKHQPSAKGIEGYGPRHETGPVGRRRVDQLRYGPASAKSFSGVMVLRDSSLPGRVCGKPQDPVAALPDDGPVLLRSRPGLLPIGIGPE